MGLRDSESKTEGWLSGVKGELERIGLGWVFRKGASNSKSVIKIVKERMWDIGMQELEGLCRTKSTLIMLNTFKTERKRARYIDVCSIQSRSGWAWLRTGRWRAYKYRDATCPLCEMGESETHILQECPSSRDLRERFIPCLRLDALDLFDSSFLTVLPVQTVESIGLFLDEHRTRRSERMKQLK